MTTCFSLFLPLPQYYTDAISFCENINLVQHGITESNLKLLRIFVKIQYKSLTTNN
jgi:hypothetical protein